MSGSRILVDDSFRGGLVVFFRRVAKLLLRGIQIARLNSSQYFFGLRAQRGFRTSIARVADDALPQSFGRAFDIGHVRLIDNG